MTEETKQLLRHTIYLANCIMDVALLGDFPNDNERLKFIDAKALLINRTITKILKQEEK